MRKNSLYVLIGMLAISFAFASCLGDDLKYDITSDVAISAFSIGDITMTDTVQTEEGNDSTISYTIAASEYSFTIDQQNNLIYNKDSLPLNTDVTKVATSITLSYGYAVTYVKNGQDTIWSESDSIDFTNPVTFKAYALDGSIRQYDVRVNVHKQDPDSLQWSLMSSSNLYLPANARHKAVYGLGKMFIFSQTDDETVEMTYSTDGLSWSELEPLSISGDVDYTSALVLDDKLYILADNQLYTSDDGMTWTQTGFTQTFDKLFAASSMKGELYVLSGTELLSLSVYDETVESAGSANEYFPVQNLSYSTSITNANRGIERVVLVGTRESTLENDTTAVVWVKLSNETTWTHYPLATNNTLGCPKLKGLVSFYYDDKLYALGGDYDIPEDQTRPTDFIPFQYLYESVDGGISWPAKTEEVTLPTDFQNRTAAFSCLVDEDDFIWVFWTPSEETQGITEVWRGRVNRLGF